MKKSLLPLLVAGALAVVGSGVANASITVALTGGVPTGNVWSYNISVDGLESLNNTSYFTIYDFAGFEAGTIFAPAGWTWTTQTLGITPGTVNVPDSATITNITFNYTGTATNGPLTESGFGADSTSTSEILGWFSYQAIKTSIATIDQGDGNLEVPTIATPEPVSMSLLGGGLALLGLLRFRRNK